MNYYDYMLAEGFTSKLVLGDDGQIWAQCTDPNTGETFLTQDLDATPILDQFVLEHPDFSLNGAKAIFSLTGYQGILVVDEAPYPLTIQAEPGRIRIAESACPSQDCVHTGWISRAGQQIICLPDKLVISLSGSGSQEFDAISG